jgi:D-alanyl-D-alanine carboxypeptidase
MRIQNAVKFLLCAAVVTLLFVVAIYADALGSEKQPAISPQSQPYDAPQEAPTDTVSIPVSEIADTRYLELINLKYPIQTEPKATLIVSAWPAVPVSTTEVTIHDTTLQAVSGLIGEARKTYEGTFYVGSGYRTFKKQAQIYNDATDKSYVQPPDHSEHQTGLAADIFVIGIGQHDMAGTDEALWLSANAWRYGLILRYPDDKQGITGIAYEPWHYRYVGQPHAWYCHQNDLCFEEYIAFLKSSGGYSTEVDGMRYSVSYQMPKDGCLNLPKDGDYSISGDNTGGYIISALG